MGPLTIFDKSFLQMLNADEVLEFTLLFEPVGTPLLIREIISDLKKRPASPDRLASDVVRALARKMGQAHGVQPADFRKLAIANLLGGDVPMFGQVPVDTTARNVQTAEGGNLLLIDSVPEQRMWDRWAAGDFSTEDEEIAAAWRTGIARVDLRAIGDGWKEFARQHFQDVPNLPQLIERVDALILDCRLDTQLELMGFILGFLRIREEAKAPAYAPLLENRYSRMVDYAPYAASILKIYLSFVGGLARGFIGPRPSTYVDLQYLFYAPFCMVFVSADKFHRAMWPATAGINTFVWGPELKDDLTRRIAARRSMTKEQTRVHAQQYEFYPVALEGSITNTLWKRYMRPPEEVLIPPREAKTIDDLEPEIRERLERAMKAFDAKDRNSGQR